MSRPAPRCGAVATSAVLAALVVGCAAGRGAAAPRFAAPEELVLGDSTEARPRPTAAFAKYPDDMRVANVEAGFATIYVVDTLGRVEYRTISFAPDVPSQIRASVCTFLRRVVHAPVVRAGRRQRAVLVGPWTFALEGGVWYNRRFDATPIRAALAAAIAADGMRAALVPVAARQHCP